VQFPKVNVPEVIFLEVKVPEIEFLEIIFLEVIGSIVFSIMTTNFSLFECDLQIVTAKFSHFTSDLQTLIQTIDLSHQVL
jgi:hypothetical protein